MSALEEALAIQIKWAKLPIPIREFQAIPHRKFRFDFAWPKEGVLVEVQGGTFSLKKLGHSSGLGISRDLEKGNLAQLNKWLILHVDTKMIQDGRALMWIRQALEAIQ